MKTSKNLSVHNVNPYLLNPSHPLSVAVIGCGGTGSQVLSNLARINVALLGLDHPGLIVEAYDNDIVEPHNIGRQLFLESETGKNKARALVERINRYFGFTWKYIESNYEHAPYAANIAFTCVDSAQARYDVGQDLVYLAGHNSRAHNHYRRPMYWFDCGNGKDYGQIILCNYHETMPSIMKRFKNILQFDDDTPSCSLAESLNKQNLFINSIIGTLATNMLWTMITKGSITYDELYVNLETATVTKKKINHEIKRQTDTPAGDIHNKTRVSKRKVSRSGNKPKNQESFT